MSPQMVTAIPGPVSRSLLAEQRRVLAGAYGTGLPCFIQEGAGATFTDVDGNLLLDLSSGMGCNLLGFSHPRVVEAVVAQAAKWVHTDHAVIPHEPYIAMCAAVCALAPAGEMKAALFNSGAEAVENAVKLAKRFTGRNDLIVLEGGFHGRTALTSAMSSRPLQRSGFGAPPAGVHHVTLAPTAGPDSPDVLLETFRSRVSPDDVAALVVEPVQGDGGVRASGAELNRGITEICAQHGILLIADEVQTGLRTGAPLASLELGLSPDLWCLGKAIGGGFPLSAVVGRADIMDSAPAGAIGGTCNGNAVACAAGLATLEVIEREDLHDRARRIGAFVDAFWSDNHHELVHETRVYGAMAGIQLATAGVTARVRERALQHGVVTVSAGRDRDVIRLLPPLCVTDEQLLTGLQIVRAAMDQEFN